MGVQFCMMFLFPMYPNYLHIHYYSCSKKIKHCTEVPEIQDEQHSKRTAPPPTAQMPESNLLIFWREAPQWDLLRGIGAIFEFRPMSGDMGVQSPNSRPFSDPRLELILLL